jgi:transcriptional regulator with XRE-family HTH domain
MGKNPIERGPVARRVSANVHRLRKQDRMSLKGLSKRLGELGRWIPLNGVHGIEQGQRRVDVDDLVALALALKVTPNDLLLPDVRESGNAEIPLTSKVVAVSARAAWEWATFVDSDEYGRLRLTVTAPSDGSDSSTTAEYTPPEREGGNDA